MNIHSIRIKSSMPIVALGIALLFVFFTLTHLISMQEDALKYQSEKFLKSIAVVLNADRDLYQAKVAELNILNNVGDKASNNEDRRENALQVKQRFEAYKRYLADFPDVVGRFDDFDKLFNEWYKASDSMVQKTFSSEAEKQSVITATDKKFEALRSILDKAGEAAEKKSDELNEQLKSEVSAFKQTAIVIALIVLAAAAWFSYIIPKNLTEQIDNLTNQIRQIASGNGDLTRKIDVRSKDEFGELATQFNNFVGNLRQLIQSILEQSNKLADLTDTLHQSSSRTKTITQTLNKASDSIVSAVHEMNLSNKEMSQVASGSADEAEQSTKKAQQGLLVVKASNEIIKQLSVDMETALSSSGELEKSSADIASVLDVIRSIAEQTNLLALNAAIEAARAGEQGRGFAVVADEVRTLATRTQESTNHIQDMIAQLQQNVDKSAHAINSGKSNVDKTIDSFSQTNQVFEGLLKSANAVSELSSQTAQATEEQSVVADDISQNLFALNDQSQAANEIAHTGEDLARDIGNLSNALNKMVNRFTV
ncbi:methyl-accepting chemotaxis protein [Catenovulum sp. SX2]|uniref:methyl-accepting chemotaxis protein n=1 Tax=Catenovulum sp. SX2 TaxID=3398614 RepID=UPI003F824F1E